MVLKSGVSAALFLNSSPPPFASHITALTEQGDDWRLTPSHLFLQLDVSMSMLELSYNGVVAVMPPHSPPAAPLRILIVDDYPDAAKSLALLLSLEGHEVTIAPNGQAALEMAGVEEPDVVLLDIGWPGRDGHEVASRLRHQAGKRPLIIAITGYGHDEGRRRSAEAGIPLHLRKPVDPQLLLRLLQGLKRTLACVRRSR
jgi:CheY-like chemotaxis protein